jgi:hypothetical protein
MGAGGYVNSDNGIHPRRSSSHWLSEIPSIKSLVMSCNMPQAARLSEKKLTPPVAHFFPVTGLLSWVVHKVTTQDAQRKSHVFTV